jgi:hypothetical protein
MKKIPKMSDFGSLAPIEGNPDLEKQGFLAVVFVNREGMIAGTISAKNAKTFAPSSDFSSYLKF